jgi:cysteinyl-tRNA synthetase
MPLHLFDTATQEKRPLSTLIDGHVSIYVCGATVQASPHLGHMRGGVAFDVLRRWLLTNGRTVTFVRNVTDIDDKILERADTTGEPWWAIASRVEREFHAAYRVLDCLAPTVEPRATGHIPDMIALTQRLMAAGAAYERSGSVYFSVAAATDYGSLSRRDPSRTRSGTDLPVGSSLSADHKTYDAGPGEQWGNPTDKKDPADFALWKAAKPGEPETASWDTPWGRARPGWHLECSAMATRYLGRAFDIHGGGRDLAFPHHENERAQSRTAGDAFAQFWMHNALVTTDGNKMSKSSHNSLLLRDALTTWRASHLRYWLLSGQYRSTLEYSADALNDAAAASARIENFVRAAWERSTTWHQDVEADIESSLQARAAAGGTARAEPCAEPRRSPASTRAAGDTDPSGWSPQTQPRTDWSDAFANALNDDLNTSQALSVLHEAVKAGNVAIRRNDQATLHEALTTVTWMTHTLGLAPSRATNCVPSTSHSHSEELIRLLSLHRDAARRRHDYQRADLIREGLAELGVHLVDTPEGTKWRHQ